MNGLSLTDLTWAVPLPVVLPLAAAGLALVLWRNARAQGVISVVALSLVFDGPARDGIVRVLAETPRVDEPDGEHLVAAALARTLTLLADRGVRRVELEGRTFDPHLPAVVATFPPHDSNPMSVVRLHRAH